MIICECGQIKEKELKDIIKEKQIITLEALRRESGAGIYCGRCIPKLENILEEELSNIDRGIESDIFEENSRINKLLKISKFIKENINPQLAMDGGAVDIIDIIEKDDITEVYLKYLGACASCSINTGPTLQGIDNMLKQLSENIKVIITNPYGG